MSGARAIALYDRFILSRPRTALAVLLGVFAFFGFWARDFRLDASADTLILEHDDDLRYFREISSRFKTEEFLVLTYTPRGDLFAAEELEQLKGLRDELGRMERVSSVLSFLDVPLLLSPPVKLTDMKGTLPTLLSPGTDLALARREFAESPVYQNLLVSRDLRSTAMLVYFKREEQEESRYKRRMELREKEYLKTALSREERAELKDLNAWHRRHKDDVRRQRHEDIAAIRGAMGRFRARARLYLGGIPMVVDDMILFVKSDIALFGTGVLLLMVATLAIVFRKVRWVVLPVLCCAVSVLVMVGILGLAGWEVTVVSSNFISIQLIMTMSFSIHVIGRYRELLRGGDGRTHHELVRETVRTIFVPSSFSCLTTIAGFASLLVCDILPVVDFGWMMTAGLCVSLAVTFLVLPLSLMFMDREDVGAVTSDEETSVTTFFARLTERRPAWILAVGLALAAWTVAGMSRLEVENSFIKYFKSSTEIHQGMKFIDEELGGTTPLDVILTFDRPAAPVPAAPAADDEFSLLEGEPDADPAKYWFTVDKLAVVEKVHDHLESQPAAGRVLSLATLVKLVRRLKGGESLDNFDLALVFNEFPERVKQVLVAPFVSVETGEARVLVRMKDSLPSLRRDVFLKQTKADLAGRLGLPEGRFRLTNVMVLYNNMLQSLFRSQISASSLTALPLLLMFVAMFRSLRTGLIAMVPNVISTTLVLGVMGWAGFPLDMMTITIVSISLGMGVEDTILYIHRFRQEIVKDFDYRATMRRCHLSIGNSMFHTSVVVTLGFSILVFSHFIPTILFGVLTAVTMVVSLVAALTLLPTLIVLLKPFGRGPAPRENILA